MTFNKRKIFNFLWKGLLSVVVLIFGFIGSIYLGFWGKLPETKDLKDLKQAQASLIYDTNDELIDKYFIYDRQPITYKDLPKHLTDALIATEDVRFYEHSGVDSRSVMRVFFKTILMGDESSGGGSTITTQLVKNLFGRKNYGLLSMPVNKIKEAIVAKRIEKLYSKQDILTMYFNTVPFSDNTFGIESASQKFFNCTTSELSLSQAATLVGTLKASHSYNPRLFPERSQLRRDVVLEQMVKYNFITKEIANTTENTKLEIEYQYFDFDQGLAPYFREEVKKQVAGHIKDLKKEDGSSYDLYKDGLKVYTTLDAGMQQYAEEAMKRHMKKLQQQFENGYGKRAPWKNKKLIWEAAMKLPEYKRLESLGVSESQIKDSLSVKREMKLFSWDKENQSEKLSALDSLSHYLKLLNAGFVAIDPETGSVKAYVGGVDYGAFKYDHVVQSKRQVGSTFKPIVYTAAIENGMNPCTYFSLQEVTYVGKDKDWTPSNASKEEDEDLNYSLEKALSNSINTIAVKVLEETGIANVIEQARRMGVESELPEVPSLALGTAEMSLMELTSAYTGYVHGGISVKPYMIARIEDRNGKILWELEEDKEDKEKAYSDETRAIIVEMLKSTINEGTATRMRGTYGLKNDMAGKTGTTQNNKDGWFVGITPKLVMAAWVGNDDHRIGFSSTAIGQGANSALPIVAGFIQQLNKDTAYRDLSDAKFERPSDEIIAVLDCDPVKRDNLLQRLFGQEEKERTFGEKKKNGIFSFLKRKKDKKEAETKSN